MRVGTLEAGSFAWELDVIRYNRFDAAHGIAIEASQFGSLQGVQVALQAGRVDVVTQDWLWVAGRRADGGDWTFVPTSTAVGGVVAPSSSPVRTINDLPGSRLGIVGGPLDKSWLILQSYGKRAHGIDLDQTVKKSFGGAQMLADALSAGQLDAALTFWPFVARAEAAGLREILGVEAAVRQLGVDGKVPFAGFVFSSEWAAANPDSIAGLVAAGQEARNLLESSDAEWRRLRPLAGAASDLELEKLKAAYRHGIIHGDGLAERQAAVRLYQILAEIGGLAMVGTSSTVPPGTFWQSPI